MSNTRREFLADSTKLLAATGFAGLMPATAPSSAAATAKRSENDTIVLGLIGARSQGMADLRQALKQPGVRCGAVCDVDDAVLAERRTEIEKIQGKAPVAYKDFRRLLDDKSIDAVIIGTPDHWHCYQMIAACEAGKDVYVEKPLANSIKECDLMVAAARKYGKVVQVG
jgi:predicted dehydrogenase